MLEPLTIAICTHNRAKVLRGMLASLASCMRPAPHGCDVLVVDNASSDHTLETSEQFRTQLPLRIVTETGKGLSSARNRAVREVRDGAIWFLDDDVTVTPGWLSAARKALLDHPQADWMGGRVLPGWTEPPPSWMDVGNSCPFKGMLVWYDEGDVARPLDASMPQFFGANIMFRKRVFDAGHRFDESLGKIGTRARLGEEAQLQTELQKRGGTGWYVPEATVIHAVPEDRLTLQYLAKWHRESGRASVSMSRRVAGFPKLLGVPRFVVRQTLTDLSMGMFEQGLGLITGLPARRARGLARFSRGLGRAAEIGRGIQHEPRVIPEDSRRLRAASQGGE